MMKRFALLLAIAASASALELTWDTFKDLTYGKSLFINFYAPWCDQCKALKPDWDKLMSAFAADGNRLVAGIDCTSDGGKPLCDAHDVNGYPTLKYGNDLANLHNYDYARDLDTLTKFTKTGIFKRPECSVSNRNVCDDAENAQMDEYFALPLPKLAAEVAAGEKRLADSKEKYEKGINTLNLMNRVLEQKKERLENAEEWNPEYQTKFDAEVEKLEEMYAEYNEEKLRAVADLRADGFGRMKSVLSDRRNTGKDEL